MARPREHGADTRDALLRTAGSVLREEGPGALSVRRLSEEVGVSTRAVYSLFGGKEGLVRAMFVDGFEALGAALRAADDAAADPVERVRALGAAYRRSALDRPHLYAVMFDCPVPEFTPSAEDDELALGTLLVLRGAVVAAVDRGALACDPDDATFALWGLVHGLASLELAGAPEHVDTERVHAAAVDAMLRGLAAPGGEP